MKNAMEQQVKESNREARGGGRREGEREVNDGGKMSPKRW